ncbi:MAG: DHA2 family efflux MFS transporter permease subunit [Proteobacteria bacterium]|nr:DHA2 family efflux MFS transporter permease subunit [Pseudomonadota bacterium]
MSSTTETTPTPFFHAPRRDTPLALRIAITCVMVGMFMQMLDSTIANVALPYMQGSLQASHDQITWVLTSYIIASAIMTGPIGWLASRFGRREIFLVSLIGFTATSAMCGLAQNLDQIVIFRLAQGAFGAALSPLSQAIILDRYPIEQRGKIMAVWSAVIMLGPILGPTLGGFLTDNYSWRWVFYVNVPIGILCALGVFFFLFEDKLKAPPEFDWYGFAFLSIALGALQLMLDRGTDKGWFDSTEILAETVIAGLSFYLFLVHQWTTKHPFLNPDLLKDRQYVSGLLLTFFVGLLLLATSALLPPYLQNLGGYSVLDTGLLLAPRGVGTMISMVIIGRLVMRSDPRYYMGIGSLVLLWTMWEMAGWTPAVSFWTLASITFIQGVAMGFIFVPMNMYTYSTLAQSYRTEGSSILNLVRNVGSAIGVSLTTTVLTNQTQVNYNQLGENATPFNRALSQNAPSLMLGPQLPFGAQNLHGIILEQSTIIAYTDTFLFMFYASLPVLLVILTLRKVNLLTAGQPGQQQHMEAME